MQTQPSLALFVDICGSSRIVDVLPENGLHSWAHLLTQLEATLDAELPEGLHKYKFLGDEWAIIGSLKSPESALPLLTFLQRLTRRYAAFSREISKTTSSRT